MYAKYHKDVEILLVYIKEAHAIDSRSSSSAILVEDPIADFERLAVAKICVTKLELAMIPAVIDHVDDMINAAYQAWPDRLYLVGKDGRIAYAGGRGHFGFRPDELTEAIDSELRKIKGAESGGR